MAVTDCCYPCLREDRLVYILFYFLFNPALIERSAVKFGMLSRRAVWYVSYGSYRLLLPLAFVKMVWLL